MYGLYGIIKGVSLSTINCDNCDDCGNCGDCVVIIDDDSTLFDNNSNSEDWLLLEIRAVSAKTAVPAVAVLNEEGVTDSSINEQETVSGKEENEEYGKIDVALPEKEVVLEAEIDRPKGGSVSTNVVFFSTFEIFCSFWLL